MKNLWIIGGDRRAVELSTIAAQHGYSVQTSGFEHCVDYATKAINPVRIDEAEPAHVTVLPFPYQKNGYIPTPLGSPIMFKELVPHLKKDSIVLVGRADEVLNKLAEERGLNVADIYVDEAFAIKNAVLSSEGAIHAAMTQSPAILHGNTCMVIGFGRIGKVLAKQLTGLGANVTVFARKPHDRALAYALGFKAVGPDNWNSTLPSQRFIFNTVPFVLIGRKELETLKRDTIIIDISSEPYGVDFDAAKELCIKASVESALPGRYSPETAGYILFDTIKPYFN